MKIAVISDTHWRDSKNASWIFNKLVEEKPEYIIHAGDWVGMDFLVDLENIAPIIGVYGNNDGFDIMGRMPKKRIEKFNDLSIGVIHGDGEKYTTLERAYNAFLGEDVDIIVFGHSHIPYAEYKNNILMFNPGSVSRPRGEIKAPSYGIINIEEGKNFTYQIKYKEDFK